MCVCLSVREHTSGTTREIFIIFVHVAYGRGSDLLRHGNEIPREGAILGVFGCKRDHSISTEKAMGVHMCGRSVIYDCLVSYVSTM